MVTIDAAWLMCWRARGSYGLLLAGFGRKLKSVFAVSSWCSNCLDVGELSRLPQCASVQPGPHPTRKERTANSPVSMSKPP